MKRLFLASLLFLGATQAQADAPRLVNADGSDLSTICIAAAVSRAAMYQKAAELGLRDLRAEELRCNGLTLSSFISRHRVASTAKQPAAYVFRKSDSSPITELCLAAVRSEQEYSYVKARYFGDEKNIEAEVQCNGMPLQTFARRYRTSSPALSLR